MQHIFFCKISSHPEFLERAATWFSQKWDIPQAEYQQSMEQSIAHPTAVPQWYVAFCSEQLIAGAGLISNDFHSRKDLTPNICALYVEPNFRHQGIARHLLDWIREDLGNWGVEKVYLITDHTSFYEKCGWTFLTMVTGDDGVPMRMYMAPTL